MAKRSSYTAAYKLYLVDLAEQAGTRREHGVSKKLIRNWRRKKRELKKLPSSARSQRVRDKPYWPELETKLHKWVLERMFLGPKCKVNGQRYVHGKVLSFFFLALLIQEEKGTLA